MRIKKYIGDKAFYRVALTVAVPIMLQNLITNLVNMLDNLMVGAIGTEQMSGVSIINQLVFIFNLAVFGALSGAGIFTAQFYGKGDESGIKYTLRYKMAISLGLAGVALVVFLTAGNGLTSMFIHDSGTSGSAELTAEFAAQYLKIILWGLFPFAITQVFASTLRETGETLAPMLISFSAVATNCVFNYLLIFGKFGFPMLGVRGAAIATVFSRYVEVAVIIIYTYLRRERFGYVSGAFNKLYIPGKLFKLITVKGMPLMFNEFFWAGGMSLLSVGYSLHGLSVVAGYSISSTVINLFNMAFVSLGASIGIIVGKQLGAAEYDEAVDTDRKLIAFSLFLSVFITLLAFIGGPKITLLYNTTQESKDIASYFIKACAIMMPAISLTNAFYFTLRSGGKTIVTFLFDSVFVMCVSVPVVFILFYAFRLSIFVIFPVVQALEIIKVLIGLVLVKKRVWVNNIVS